jgi:hypothetical protein
MQPSATGRSTLAPSRQPPPPTWDSGVSLAELHHASCAFLLDVVRPEDALFPFSTTVRGGEYVNDFDHPAAIRYTINSLLGLQAAATRQPDGPDPTEVARLTETFLDRHGDRIDSPADLGLLLVLLGEGNLHSRHVTEALAALRRIVRSSTVGRLTMQDVSWMLWGACAAARAGVAGAAETASELRDLISTRFVDPKSLFPRHSLSRARRDFVSFGALTYFLRSMVEVYRLTDDAWAKQTFEEGVRAVVAIQGPLGEWPWLMSVRRRVPLDFYPVFAVHQDSMSMLFLHPALDAGLPVSDAIETSLAWVWGRNELSTPMINDRPFVAYRSVERIERLPRVRRYARSVSRSVSGLAGRSAEGRGVRINTECRSYHLGWILYVWSGRAPAIGVPDPGERAAPVTMHRLPAAR